MSEHEAYAGFHDERGFGKIHPTHEDDIRHDPYQRSKSYMKFTVEPHELERHERGAFRDSEDSRYFTMHPKKQGYRDELEKRHFEHAQNTDYPAEDRYYPHDDEYAHRY